MNGSVHRNQVLKRFHSWKQQKKSQHKVHSALVLELLIVSHDLPRQIPSCHGNVFLNSSCFQGQGWPFSLAMISPSCTEKKFKLGTFSCQFSNSICWGRSCDTIESFRNSYWVELVVWFLDICLWGNMCLVESSSKENCSHCGLWIIQSDRSIVYGKKSTTSKIHLQCQCNRHTVLFWCWGTNCRDVYLKSQTNKTKSIYMAIHTTRDK